MIRIYILTNSKDKNKLGTCTFDVAVQNVKVSGFAILEEKQTPL